MYFTEFHRNYSKSHVLPICLTLLDASSYKHTRKDLFQLEPFIRNEIGFQFIEIDELSGLRILQETIDGSSVVVYITQKIRLQPSENRYDLRTSLHRIRSKPFMFCF